MTGTRIGIIVTAWSGHEGDIRLTKVIGIELSIGLHDALHQDPRDLDLERIFSCLQGRMVMNTL